MRIFDPLVFARSLPLGALAGAHPEPRGRCDAGRPGFA